MGKAKNSKKHRKRIGQTSEPVQLVNHAEDAKVNLLLTNIGSIHDKKRAEACVLLANVFSKDVSNTIVLEKMSGPDILSKLSMRLVDSVEIVRIHASGALRNMATCRNQSVSKRLVSIGLMGTTISLVMEGLGCTPMSDTQASYIEQLIACVSNLCASCEEAVVELRSRQFCPSLLHILNSEDLHPSVKRAAAQCLHTTTENESVISQSISSIAGGEDVLVAVAQRACSIDTSQDEKLCGLYCLGTLTNICGSLPSGDTVDLTQKMQHILPLLLAALELSDEVLNVCISPTIDVELTESQQQKASELPAISSNSGMILEKETAIEDNEKDGMKDGDDDDSDVIENEEGGEEVYVGGDIDKPWTSAFEVVEVAAEVLANMAVVLKEQCGGNDEELRGDYDEGEWEDDDDNERRMEAIAAIKASQSDEHNFGGMSLINIDLGVFDVRSAVGALLSILTPLHSCIEVIVNRSEKEHAKFSSSASEILSCADKLLTALSNFLYLVKDWTELDVHTLMDLLLKQFNSYATIFRGVTPSGSCGDNAAATNIWVMSSLLDQTKLQSIIRNTLSANVCCLATLHRMPMDEPLLAMSDNMNAVSKSLRSTRLVTLIRGISSVPFWEVTQHCLDMVSFLASIELQFSEVKVVSNTLLRRLSDPSALRVTTRDGISSLCDASILVMEACISSFIDLHSSDDPNIYSVYMSLNSPALLQEAFSDFKNKIQNETAQLDREEVQQCRETLLNLKRFIKYKATPP